MDYFDPISVLEAAYRLDSNQRDWMSGIVRELAPAWDEGFGVGMFEMRLDDEGRPDIGELVYRGDMSGEFERVVRAMNRSIDQRQIELSYQPGMVYATLSQRLNALYEDFREDPVYQKYAHPMGVYDCASAQVVDPSGTRYILAAPLSEIRATSPYERDMWARVVAHVAAGDRLRRKARSVPLDPDTADAVLDARGHLLHIELDGDRDAHRDSLERAAEAIGRARGRMRESAPSEALELWKALVEGRYSLVEYRDTDGKQYLLARRNAPRAAEPEALDQRERQVVQYVVMGHPDDLISYELGLPVHEVTRCVEAALRKLNLDTRDQLVRLWFTLQSDSSTPQ